MRKFEVGQKYSVRSIGDSNCVWIWEVVDRTAKTITIQQGEKIKKCRINAKTSEYLDAEAVYPLGNYSMCPILSADRVA